MPTGYDPAPAAPAGPVIGDQGSIGLGAYIDWLWPFPDITTPAQSTTRFWLISMDGLSEEIDIVDVSSAYNFVEGGTINNPGVAPDGYKTFVAGLIDAGEMSCEVNFSPAATPFVSSITGQVELRLANTINPAWDGAFFQALALLQSTPRTIQYDDRTTQSVSWKVVGKPTFTAQATGP